MDVNGKLHIPAALPSGNEENYIVEDCKICTRLNSVVSLEITRF